MSLQNDGHDERVVNLRSNFFKIKVSTIIRSLIMEPGLTNAATIVPLAVPTFSVCGEDRSGDE